MGRADLNITFLEEEVPLLLAKLSPTTKPLWGSFTPQHMLEHLQFMLAVSRGAKILKVVSPWYKRPFLKMRLLGSAPFPKNLANPYLTKGQFPLLKYESFEVAKANLIRAIEDTLYFIRKNPEIRTQHPLIGTLTPEEWKIYHRKHFEHHFRQFGLLPALD